MSDTVIKVENVSKKFCRSIKHTMIYGATDLSRSFLGLDQHSESLRKGEFWAVDNVSFELKRGETLGILGPNGSGKSTILKMLNGIFMPDRGKIEINGRIGALIEVGAGFHPMLTGRENIYINATILGMTKREIDKKFDEIVDFADIGDFIDSPVKHYSSGMYVRLGFSVAAAVNPDIFLIDEVLSVGDLSFKRKCFQRFAELQNNDTSIVFVSHNVRQIQRICNKVILLDSGKIVTEGKSDEVALLYNEMCCEKERSVISTIKRFSEGTGEVNVSPVKVLNYSNCNTSSFHTGDSMGIEIRFKAEEPIESPVVGIAILTSDFIRVFSITHKLNKSEWPLNKEGVVQCIISSLSLLPGTYFVNISIKELNNRLLYREENAVGFLVKPSEKAPELDALVHIPTEWEYKDTY